MRKLVMVVALTVVAAPGFGQAAQPVSTDTIDALRQMAIAAGQTSSSRAETATLGEDMKSAEREAIDRHRTSFLARTYVSDPNAVATHEPEEDSARSVINAWQPTRTGQMRLSVPVDVARSVDAKTTLALRQLAIDAGQVSRSSDKIPVGTSSAAEAEQKTIEDHKAAFFARNFGGGPVM